MFRDLTSYASCQSDANGFVDASDFLAMAINYAIEQEMNAADPYIGLLEDVEFGVAEFGDDDWMDAMESRVDAMALQAKVMEDMEKGNIIWAW